MTKDPIVEEIHSIRKDISREAGDDLERIARAAKDRQEDSKRSHEIVSLPPRSVESVKKAS